MSQNPHEQGPPSSSSRHLEQASQHGKNAPPTTANLELTTSRDQDTSTPQFERTKGETTTMLPPPAPEQEQQQQPDTPDTRPPSRLLGMQSILNPPQQEAAASLSTEQRTSTGSNLAIRGSPVTSTIGELPALSPRILKRPVHGSPPIEAVTTSATREGRRVLTPRSPALRAASLGPRSNPASSHAPVQTSTVLGGSRVYTAEPGIHAESDIPPMPSAAVGTRFGSSYPPLPYSSRVEPRRGSGGRENVPTPVSTSVPATQNEDPSTSHSSYSQSSQAPSAVTYGNALIAQGIYPHHQRPQPTDHPQHGLPQSVQVESHFDIGHGSYQRTLTIDTESGPMMFPVEVDVQQASKMADEKRKRNAGASARFRARRKEKEKEANTTIDSLQKAIRDLTEEREFYRGERDWYRDYTTRHLGPNAPPVRPPSPRRMLPLPSSAVQPADDSSSRWHVLSREGTESPTRSQRRRTGDYQPSFGLHAAGTPMSQPQPSAYNPSFVVPPPPPAALQPSLLEPQPPRSSNPPLPPTRSISYDPFFRRDPYDRSWNPNR